VIVWLASFPRSGNTLVRVLLRGLYGWQSSALYDESGGSMISELGLAPNGQPPTESMLQEARGAAAPYFLKTHELPQDRSPALYVVRDGRDTLVSYAHFIRTYEPHMAQEYSFDEVLQLLIESTEHFGGWSGHIEAWRARTGSARTEWVRYEDLLREPVTTLREALQGLGIATPVATNAPYTFSELNLRWPGFFRSGVAGSWVREMSDELHDLFWMHHGETMEWLGYPRYMAAGDAGAGPCLT
jgi:hypothetical protein